MYIILSSFDAFLLNDGIMFIEQRVCIFFQVKIKSKSHTYTGQTHDLAPSVPQSVYGGRICHLVQRLLAPTLNI